MRASPLERVPSSASPRRFAPRFRQAALGDLAPLLELELACFDEARRDTPAAIRRSLASSRIEVWVLDGPAGGIDAALFLKPVRKSLSVESLAVRPGMRGRGVGRSLLEWAANRARAQAAGRLTLDADASDPDLLGWYERHGYQRSALMVSFYGPGRDAWRMRCNPGDPGTDSKHR